MYVPSKCKYTVRGGDQSVRFSILRVCSRVMALLLLSRSLSSGQFLLRGCLPSGREETSLQDLLLPGLGNYLLKEISTPGGGMVGSQRKQSYDLYSGYISVGLSHKGSRLCQRSQQPEGMNRKKLASPPSHQPPPFDCHCLQPPKGITCYFTMITSFIIIIIIAIIINS